MYICFEANHQIYNLLVCIEFSWAYQVSINPHLLRLWLIMATSAPTWHIEVETKWPTICKQFQCIFMNIFCHFAEKFTEVVTRCPIDIKSSLIQVMARAEQATSRHGRCSSGPHMTQACHHWAQQSLCHSPASTCFHWKPTVCGIRANSIIHLLFIHSFIYSFIYYVFVCFERAMKYCTSNVVKPHNKS